MPQPAPNPGPRPPAFRRLLAGLARLLGRPAGSDRAAPDPPPPAPSERRRVPRFAAPPGVRTAVHLEAPDEGPDVALALVDVSEDGAGLRLRTAVRPGEEAYLALYPPGQVELVLVRRRAAVVWCRPESGNTFRAGVRFASRLTPEDLGTLAN